MSRGIGRFALEVTTEDDTMLEYTTPTDASEDKEDVKSDKVSFPSRSTAKPKRKFKAPVGITLKTQQTNNIAAEERKQLELARRIRYLANKTK